MIMQQYSYYMSAIEVELLLANVAYDFGDITPLAQ